MRGFPTDVRTCAAPTMRNHRGRTWDHAHVTLPDGSRVKAHLDTTWGSRFYFQFEGRWCSAPIAYQMPNSWDFDLRPDSWEADPLPVSGVGCPRYIPWKRTHEGHA
jgi:hypothetical protein